MQNEQQENRPKENLTILRKKLIGKLKKKLTLELNNNSTFYSPRNKAKAFHNLEKDFPAIYKLTFIDLSSMDMDQTSEKKKTRTDNFGREIKKGGKHKIVFADELQFVKQMKLDDKKIKEDFKRKNSCPKNKEEKNKENIELFKNIKRSNSFDLSANYLSNHYYNIDNFTLFKKKPSKFNNLDIIDFQSTKKENKLNTYFFRKNIVLADEGNVCCSCYCNIF